MALTTNLPDEMDHSCTLLESVWNKGTDHEYRRFHYIAKRNGGWFLFVYGDDDSWEDVAVSFCPFCGERLS